MGKIYLPENVYEAAQKRLEFVFDEFPTVIISFSGGKDSGLLLHMAMDHIKNRGIDCTPVLYHQDFEAQYTWTTKYVTETFAEFQGRVEPYWFCQPMAVRTAVSATQMYWYPWDDEHPELWIREIPDLPYVYTLENNPFALYKYRMDYHAHALQFARWIRSVRGGPVCTLLGLRAQESLNRYAAISDKRHPYKGEKWITKDAKDVYSASPIYDWAVEDVWTANAKLGYPYNHLYDLMHKAGVSIHDMRVASPFSDEAKANLNLYRVLEPETWTKLVGRVQGVNFGAIYSRTHAAGYRDVKLPAGHTWKSYTKFLLSTLPKATRAAYIEKFVASIKFWHRRGGGFTDEVIDEIRAYGYSVEENGVSNYTKNKDRKIVFRGRTPDDTDDVTKTKDIPSWKRMCMCILKNDHSCKYMGFGETAEQKRRVAAIKEKYANL